MSNPKCNFNLPSRLCDGHGAPVAGAVVDVAAVRPDELGDVRDAEADAVVGEGGADDGQLVADGQHELVVDHRLAARDRQLLRADVVLQGLALVPANLKGDKGKINRYIEIISWY